MKLANFSRTAVFLGGAVISWSPSLGVDAFAQLHRGQMQRSQVRAATGSDALSPLPASPRHIKSKRDRTQRFKKAPAVVTVQQSQTNEQWPSEMPGGLPTLTKTVPGLTENPQTAAVDKASRGTRLTRPTGDEKIGGRHGARRVSVGRQMPLATRTVGIAEPSSVPRPQMKVQTQSVSREAWRAPYQVSMATQARLKDAAAKMMGRPEEERSRAILLALVNTPREQVNEANVVCSLTLSAKCMTANMKPSTEQRRLLFLVFDILKIMVEQRQLGARQLCNAIYAIAKHYNKDNSILPAPPVSTAMSSNEMIGVAEAWILQDQDEDTPEHRLESTIEMIANSLTANLEDEKKQGPRKPSVGEVSMACWAYGVLRQRVRPPGWVVPPQLSRLPSYRKPRSAIKNVQLVTFEQWAVNADDSEAIFISNPVGVLFDAIGNFLSEERHESESLTTLVEHMSWSEMANVAWAFSNHGHCRTNSSERLLAALAQEATTRIQRASERNARPFLPRDISQLVWSIGTLQSDNFRLGEDLARLIDATAIHYLLGASAARPLQTWSSADLVQLAIALAHGRIDHLQLLRSLYEEVNLRVSEDLAKGFKSPDEYTHSFQEWEVSVLLWVQARLYLKEEQGQIFGAFLQHSTRWLVQRAEETTSLEKLGIGAQEQANLAWSLTVLEAYQSPHTLRLLKAIFKETSTAGTKNEFIQLEHAHQLWQALYLMEYEWPEAVESVPSWFRDFLKEKWSAEKARQKISSARHRSLSKTLDLMGVAHFNEHDEDIDVAIVLKENSSWTNSAKKADHNHSHFKVAVEFDGPLHFTREAFDELGNKVLLRTLGHTALKYRLLKRQGWAVVRVPFYEFDKIPFWASMERQRYLQRLLKTHGNIRFSEVDVSEYKAIAPNRRSRFD